MSTEQTKPGPPSADESPATETQPAPRRGGTRLILPIVLIGIPVIVFAYQGLSSLSNKGTGPDLAQTKDSQGSEANRRRQAETQYLLAAQAIRKNEYSTALLHLQRAVELFPDHPMAHADLGSTLVKKERFEEAVKHFREDLRINPGKSSTHYNLGVALCQLNNLADAIPEYRAALESDPNLIGAQYNLALTLNMIGRADEAVEAFERTIEIANGLNDAAERDSVLVRAHNGLARAWILRGDMNEAARHAERVLEIDSDSAEAFLALGEIAASNGKPDEARGYYQQVLKLNPNDKLAQARIERLSQGDSAEPATADASAETGGEQAAPTPRPNNEPRSTEELAQLLARLEKSVEENPDDASALTELGITFARAGRLQDARGHLTKAVRLEPERADLHLNLAQLLHMLKEYDYAEQEYRLGFLYGGGNVSAYRALLGIQLTRGAFDRAIQTARQGINDVGDEPELLFELIWLLATCPDGSIRDADEAVAFAGRLKSMWESLGSPQVRGPQVLDAVAAAYAEAARFDEAVEVAERAVELAGKVPDHPRIVGIQARLEQYRQQKPWREPLKSADADPAE